MPSNPYTGAQLFSFIALFFKRLFLLITFQLPLSDLSTDETQILALILVAISSAIVGSMIVHRKMTMFANSLSHTILFGLVITYFLFRSKIKVATDLFGSKLLLVAAIITGFATSFFSWIVAKMSRLRKDASIGLVFSILSAIGILLISLCFKNSHIGVELIVGNVDAIHLKDLSGLFTISIIVICATALFYRPLKLSTFDPAFANLIRFKPTLMHIIIVSLLSISTLYTFKVIGIALVLAFLIVPTVIAKNYAKSFSSLLFYSIFMGILSAIIGVAISRHILSVYDMPLSTGGLTVCTMYLLYMINQVVLRLIKSYLANRTVKEKSSKNNIAQITSFDYDAKN